MPELALDRRTPDQEGLVQHTSNSARCRTGLRHARRDPMDAKKFGAQIAAPRAYHWPVCGSVY